MADREKRCEKCLRRIAFIGWFMGNPQWVHAEASRFPYGHVAVPEVEQPESLAFVNTLFHSDPEAHISAAGATARRAIAKKIDRYVEEKLVHSALAAVPLEEGRRHSTEEPEYSVQLPLCPLPPPGWVCTRGAGHDGQGGPCAAIPLPNTVRLLPAVPQPGQNSCTKKQVETRE